MRESPDSANRRELSGRLERAALVLVPLVFAAIAFLPITDNYFFADDFVHFFAIRNGWLLDYIMAPQGGHLLITTNSVFYLLSRLFGPSPEPYFWFALATHLFNVYLLSLAIGAFTQSQRLACLGATLWGISPTNQGSLGWYSVYGHVLATTAVLALLIQLGRIANGRPPTWRTALAWILLLLAASTSFGVGIGITLAFPVTVAAVLSPANGRGRLVLVTSLVAVALPFLYVGLYRLYPSPFGGGTTIDSVLAPVVGHVSQCLRLWMHLLTSGVASLIAGSAFDWSDYPGRVGFVIALLFLASLVGALIVGDQVVRRRILACVVLVLAGYGFIAMGRGDRLSPEAVVPLRAIRYHYAVPAIIAIVCCLILSAFERGLRLHLSAAVKNALLADALLLIGGVGITYAGPIDHHERARHQTTVALTGIREHIDAAPPGGDVYIPNADFGGIGPVLRRVPQLFYGWAGVFIVFFPDNVVDGKHVYFIDERAPVVRAAQRGRRTAGLIVSPPGVEPPPASNAPRWRIGPRARNTD